MENGAILNGGGSDLQNGTATAKVTNGTILGGHKRSLSGSILSKLSFLRASTEDIKTQATNDPPSPERLHREETAGKKTRGAMAMAYVEQQQKTRRRKGSLRKAALLGRGAQREKRESEASPLHIHDPVPIGFNGSIDPMSLEDLHQSDGLESEDVTPRPSMDGYAISPVDSGPPTLPTLNTNLLEQTSPPIASSPILTYTSTTDEDEVLSIPKHHSPNLRNDSPMSSGSETYFPPGPVSMMRRRSAHKATSPLSLGGLVASPLPNPDADWDYSATEWWGWVVLIVTWIVFVVGMGSCLGVWSWAWDVGEVPSAPLELSDDHTLPIVGYYPALIILTGVMAWVWVVVAWVGMKYFRHAKISGD